MAWTDHTDPGAPRHGVRHVRLALKDYAVLVGLAAAFWAAFTFVTGLMYYERTSGERLRLDVDHHVESSEPAIEKLEKDQDQLADSLHRIELRQIQLAPRRMRDALPPIPPGSDAE